MTVGGVAVEPAADVVVHPPAGHGVEGEPHIMLPWRLRLIGLPGQQILEHQGLRELGRCAPASLLGVHSGVQLSVGVVEDAVQIHITGPWGVEPGGGAFRAARLLEITAQVVPHGVGCAGEVGTPGVPGVGDGFKHLPERGRAPAWGGREVRAAEERGAVRCEPGAERPASLPGERLYGLHVDRVQIGPLLPVHLDAHEVRVEEGGGRLILERFPLHDVAPVAGGVSDAQEDGLILGSRLLHRLRSPGVPVDRIVGVLQQVGARLAGKMVGHAFPHVMQSSQVGRIVYWSRC